MFNYWSLWSLMRITLAVHTLSYTTPTAF